MIQVNSTVTAGLASLVIWWTLTLMGCHCDCMVVPTHAKARLGDIATNSFVMDLVAVGIVFLTTWIAISTAVASTHPEISSNETYSEFEINHPGLKNQVKEAGMRDTLREDETILPPNGVHMATDRNIGDHTIKEIAEVCTSSIPVPLVDRCDWRLSMVPIDSAKVAELQVYLQSKEEEVTHLQLELAALRAQVLTLEVEQSHSINHLKEVFEHWRHELEKENEKEEQSVMRQELPLIDSPIVPLMVAQRPIAIADALAFSDEPRMLTTVTRPLRIMHVNASWTNAFGWELDEVAGASTSFLEGPNTDSVHFSKYRRDVTERGYGATQIIQYRRDGRKIFSRLLTLPVFAPSQTNGLPSLVSSLSRVDVIDHVDHTEDQDPRSTTNHGQSHGNFLPVSASNHKHADYAQVHSVQCKRSRRAPFFPSFNGKSHPRAAHEDIARSCLNTTNFEVSNWAQFEAQQPSSHLGTVLEYMSISLDALILTDHVGRILSVNRPWVELCGYSLGDIEGQTCNILQGRDTDMDEVKSFDESIRRGQRSEAKLINYKKNGLAFRNHVIVLPILSPRNMVNNRPRSLQRFYIAKLEDAGGLVGA